MKSFNENVAKYAAKTRLKAVERRELRERILMYMEYHPLPKDMRTVAERTATSGVSFFGTVYARAVAGAFVVLLVVVSVPLAAEHAVPGDVLYPVKTQLNEGVRAQFASSPYEKIAFQTELMERRIAEARLLAKEGKLSEETEAKIAASVKVQAKAVQQSIENLRASDADEAAIATITFGSALDVQSAFFASSTESTDGIASVVREAKVTADAERGTTTPSYELLSARVEQATTRAYELLASIDSSATPEESAQIERRFEDIGRKVRMASLAHDEGNDERGAALLSVALSDTQKLISFMTDIDVRENVELETLVPVVLTPEERIERLQEGLSELNATWGSSEDGKELPEAVVRAQNEIVSLLGIVGATLDAANVMDAEDAITAAEGFLLNARLATSTVAAE